MATAARSTFRERQKTRPKCIIYCRVSDLDPKKEANVNSLDRQERQGVEHALALGWSREDVIVLREQYSGEELDFRPDINRAIAAAQAGECACFVFKKLNRISREPTDTLTIIRKFRRAGCKIECIEEPVGESDDDLLLTFVKGYSAHREWKEMRKKSQEGKQHILKNGHRLRQSYARYGYVMDRENRRYLLDAVSAEVVRRVFRLIGLEGYSTHRVARELNADGVPSPRTYRGHQFRDGRRCLWTDATIADIVRDETYLGGRVVWGRTRCVERQRSGRFRQEKQARDQWEVYETDLDTTPAIIDKVAFDRANGALNESAAVHRTRNLGLEYLLRGACRCSVCGGALQATCGKPRPGGRLRYYRCGNGASATRPVAERCHAKMVPADWIESVVWDRIVAMIGDRESLRERVRLVAGDDAEIARIRETVAEYERQLDEEETLIRQVMNQWNESVRKRQTTLATMFEGQLSLSNEKIEAARLKLDTARGRLAGMATSEDTLASFESLLDAVGAVIAESAGALPFAVKERIVVALRTQVVGAGKTARVRFLAVKGLDGLDAVMQSSCSRTRQNSIPIEFDVNADLVNV